MVNPPRTQNPHTHSSATSTGPALPEDGRARVRIEDLRPSVDDGRHPAKRVVGDAVSFEVDLIGDGHDKVAGVLQWRRPDDAQWQERLLEPLVNDRYRARLVVDEIGRWSFRVRAWIDRFETWRHGLSRKADVGQDVDLELREGAILVEEAAGHADGDDAKFLRDVAQGLSDGSRHQSRRVEEALSTGLAEKMHRDLPRAHASTTHEYPLIVDPDHARFSTWYEFFPRSCGDPSRHGTFADAQHRLDYVAQMGFDVVYLPPIHPVGTTFRKGPNNSLSASPDDPGSPWAIGAPEGGHTAVHPALGTLADFDALVHRATQLGIRVAIDVAFQCSPDHPWVKEHPQWFKHRADGSIQYAENPPKKYQDVYPFDFETDDWKNMWTALRDVFSFWSDHGVKIFRVDNPHTKPLPFWEWCIGQIKARHRDAVFLAEAFTRPKLMYHLAKIGFTQSYTYFTWRSTSWELRTYLHELVQTDVAEFFRPNFWPNTPDILPEELQWGGRPAFVSRLVLAATLSSNYGIYGPAYELMDNVARPGSGEYLDNEKYEIKDWNIDSPDSLRPIITHINRIRCESPALQHTHNLVFHRVDNDQLLVYSKRHRDDVVLVVVTLDHHHRQSGWLDLDLSALGVEQDERYQVHDLLTGSRYFWTGARNYVELEPHSMPAHIFKIRHRIRTERDFDYFA